FSNYELVKSETMNDWRTHNGADLAADAGSEAVAVYAGVVTCAVQDPLWGGCVTLRLDTGYEVTYAGLGTLAVQEGQRVSQGEPVGTVGEAPAESALPSHLHIEVMSGISYIDPAVLLGS
ncbi:MAG: M23 family metallopeptidase, partial [Oscillospiraceae bacterium]|nr:M23 family metallopeptidase [Oscillospiraceae bacterium]